jgi:hypothetical protein
MNEIRTFKSGATRNLDDNKFEYDGFLSVDVIKRFAQYMHSHRIQADGSLRASDNWKKGIPTDAYMKSMFRHFVDVWEIYDKDGINGKMKIKNPEGQEVDLEEVLCSLFFNVQGMLHELLKQKK